MLRFVGKAYRLWLNIILWITLIGYAICGIFVGFYVIGGGDASTPRADGYSIIGMFVGALIGLIVNILFGGFIANFLIVVENLKKISKNLGRIANIKK